MPVYLPTASPAASDALPHRRAALLMFCIGGLLIASGLCGIVPSILANESEWQERLHQQQQLMDDYLREQDVPDASNPQSDNPLGHVDAAMLRDIVAIVSMLLLGGGAVFIALGQAVRNRSHVASILSLILTSITLAIGLLFSGAMLISAIAEPPTFVCACGSFIPLGLLVAQLVTLIGALRARPIGPMMIAFPTELTMPERLAMLAQSRPNYGSPKQEPR